MSHPIKHSVLLKIHREAIQKIVLKHHALNVRVFGSVALNEDHAGSDLDLLIDPTPDTTLMDIGAIRAELKALLGVPVDVFTPHALPEHFREDVIKKALPL
jgi:predicted nucleotidyltransferase